MILYEHIKRLVSFPTYITMLSASVSFGFVSPLFHVLFVYNISVAFHHTVPCSHTDFLTPGLHFTRGHHMKPEKYIYIYIYI